MTDGAKLDINQMGSWDPECKTYSYAGPDGDTLHIEVPEEVEKIQRGLNNLGMLEDEPDGMFGENSGGGLKQLLVGVQEKAGMKPTGEYDAATQALIQEQIDGMIPEDADESLRPQMEELKQQMQDMKDALDKLNTIKAPGREHDTVLDTVYNPDHYEVEPGMCKDMLMDRLREFEVDLSGLDLPERPPMDSNIETVVPDEPAPEKGGGIHVERGGGVQADQGGLAGRGGGTAATQPEEASPGEAPEVLQEAIDEKARPEESPEAGQQAETPAEEKPEINFQNLKPAEMPMITDKVDIPTNMPVLESDGGPPSNMPVIRDDTLKDGFNSQHDVVADGGVETGWGHSLSQAWDQALAAVGQALDVKPEAAQEQTMAQNNTASNWGPTTMA